MCTHVRVFYLLVAFATMEHTVVQCVQDIAGHMLFRFVRLLTMSAIFFLLKPLADAALTKQVVAD